MRGKFVNVEREKGGFANARVKSVTKTGAGKWDRKKKDYPRNPPTESSRGGDFRKVAHGKRRFKRSVRDGQQNSRATEQRLPTRPQKSNAEGKKAQS